MFLFLSKLLPLLVYPLGVALLLLLAALILLWQRPRWAATAIVTAGLILVISGNGAVASAMLRSLEWRYLPPPTLPQAEAIVVLGGAIKTHEPPRPWIDVTEQGDRVLHGARLYLNEKSSPADLERRTHHLGRRPERFRSRRHGSTGRGPGGTPKCHRD